MLLPEPGKMPDPTEIIFENDDIPVDHFHAAMFQCFSFFPKGRKRFVKTQVSPGHCPEILETCLE
jgi:hypothetical protein